MTVKSKKTKLDLRKAAAVMLLIVSAAYIYFSPQYFLEGLNKDHYREYFLHKVEPTVGIIKIWHIVTFKPFIGSLGTWLSQRAKEYSGRYINVYFDVVSLSPEEAENELKRGEIPDIISFAEGTLPYDSIKSIDGTACSVPYCASGWLLLYDPNRFPAGNDSAEIIEQAGTEQDFKTGKAPSCVCDVRGAGDLYRAKLIGKCPFFEAEPVHTKKNDLIQYAGISSSISDEKLAYAQEFLKYLTEDAAQSTLSRIGLIPISSTAKAEYDIEWLKMLYESFDPNEIYEPEQ